MSILNNKDFVLYVCEMLALGNPCLISMFFSVYNPTFLDELQARFEGKEFIATTSKMEPSKEEGDDTESLGAIEQSQREREAEEVAAQVASTIPRGDWKEVDDCSDNDNQMDEEVTTNTAVDEDLRGGMSNQATVRSEQEQETVEYELDDGRHGAGRLDIGTVDGAPMLEETDDVDGEPLQDQCQDDANADRGAEKLKFNETDTAAIPSDVAITRTQGDNSGNGFEGCNLASLVTSAPRDSTIFKNATSDDIEDVDADGEPLAQDEAEDNADGEPLPDEEVEDDTDGEPLAEEVEDDADGQPLC